jgi:hypothetical protein
MQVSVTWEEERKETREANVACMDYLSLHIITLVQPIAFIQLQLQLPCLCLRLQNKHHPVLIILIPRQLSHPLRFSHAEYTGYYIYNRRTHTHSSRAESLYRQKARQAV